MKTLPLVKEGAFTLKEDQPWAWWAFSYPDASIWYFYHPDEVLRLQWALAYHEDHCLKTAVVRNGQTWHPIFQSKRS